MYTSFTVTAQIITVVTFSVCTMNMSVQLNIVDESRNYVRSIGEIGPWTTLQYSPTPGWQLVCKCIKFVSILNYSLLV